MKPPTSPNTAPATQNESHDWSASHMKHLLQCAEQQESPSNLTKYCACHAKWISCLIRVSYETSFPMRRASNVNLQPQQILRLPRNLQVQDCSGNSLNCFRQYKDDSRIIRPWSEDDPRMIRPWNRHLAPAASETLLVRSWRFRAWSEDDPTIKSSSRTRRFGDLTRPILETILYWKIQHFALRLSPKMSRNAVPATKSHTPTSPNTAPATQNESLGSYSLGIYSLSASILSWHLFSLGIYSLLASILSRHLFSLGIYSLLASILSRHLFSLGIYSL